MVLCLDIEPQSAEIIAENIRISVGKSCFGGHCATVSVGAVEAMLSKDDSDMENTLEHLCKESDDLLYDAKNSGRNKCMVKRIAV